MADVFQNIDPPSTSPPGECVSPPPLPKPSLVRGGVGHTRWLERGWGVNILEDVRHSSVLYLQYVESTTGRKFKM